MIARTKTHVVAVIFLAVFPLEPAFWPAQFMFCIMFFKEEIEQPRSMISLENMKMVSPFRLHTNTL